MDHALWNAIQAFDLDHPVSEYGFSTRLAKENGWTINFTAGAVLEYKKFMYLAATSGSMVSPSPIVDVVWHQHLIFTKSYQAFCTVLGKKIEHIPSTHHRLEADKFERAKAHTQQQYQAVFGKQPTAYWLGHSMLDSLPLPPPKTSLNLTFLAGFAVFCLLLAANFYLLRPVYASIDNPWFLIGLLLLTGIAVVLLGEYNVKQWRALVDSWNKDSFLFHLTPMELIYLDKGKLADVVHGVVNRLVIERKIAVEPDNQLKSNHTGEYANTWDYTVLDLLAHHKKLFYPVLLRSCLVKPVFTNVQNSVETIKRHLLKSAGYWKVLLVNMMVLSGLLLLGMSRLLIGMSRDKPVLFLTIALIGLVIVSIFWLINVQNGFLGNIIPQYTLAETLKQDPKATRDPSWSYYQGGNAALAASFLPLVGYVNRNENNSAGSCGSSCGSSCGGGGDGGGCGGCGGD